MADSAVMENLKTFNVTNIKALCEGRLTLESGVPVSTTDQTAKTSVYWTPYRGNRIEIYNGTVWNLYTFSELTLALGTLSDATLYYVYVYDNAGTLTLESSTTATALQDGIKVKSGDTTRRYLGMFYTTATTTTEDSRENRYLCNWNNEMQREGFVWPGGGSNFATTSTSYVEFASGVDSRISYLTHGEKPNYFSLHAYITGGAVGQVGLGPDSTTQVLTRSEQGVSAQGEITESSLAYLAAAGKKYMAGLFRTNTGTVTLISGSASPLDYRTYLTALIWC